MNKVANKVKNYIDSEVVYINHDNQWSNTLDLSSFHHQIP